MRFQIQHMFYVFCLVFTAFIFSPVLQSAHAQLSDCNCSNSSDSTCADGFLVTFEERVDDTFIYSVCNVDTDECNAPMDLSHADIIIPNAGCIPNPETNISTTIIGTDGQSTRSCNTPTNRDPSCKDIPDPIPSGLLIKCDNTNGVYEPDVGECVTIEIEISNAQGLGIGPTVALNKAGPVCGNGCLLGPSCESCDPPPPNACDITVIKELNGSEGPATFGYSANYDGSSEDFNFFLTPPNTPSINFELPLGETVDVVENDLPDGWSLSGLTCVDGAGISCDFSVVNQQFACTCEGDGGGSATCTFTNDPPDDPPCTIEIFKETDPDGSLEEFSFETNQTPTNFMLQDGESQVLSTIDVGVTAGIQETLPENWVLDNIVCTGGDQSQFSISLEDRQVNVTCDTSDPQQTRSCTFMNRFDPPPIGSGCCIEAQGICFEGISQINCPVPPNEAFLLGQSCVDPRCETPPPGEGCCVESEGLCSITTAENCPVPPNAEYLGNGSTCTDQAICIPDFSRTVPTISQWGMIAMAGLLGVFSLFVIIRRQKYQIS